MRKIMCLVLTVICLLALAGCGGGTKNAEAPVQKQAAEKVLRVGIDADYPPFGYYQEVNKTFLGFDVELIQGVARKMGYTKVEFRRSGIQQPVALPAGRAGGCGDFLHDDYG